MEAFIPDDLASVPFERAWADLVELTRLARGVDLNARGHGWSTIVRRVRGTNRRCFVIVAGPTRCDTAEEMRGLIVAAFFGEMSQAQEADQVAMGAAARWAALPEPVRAAA